MNTYRLKSDDSITFDTATVSTLSTAPGLVLVSTTTIRIGISGTAFAQANIRPKAVDAIGSFMKMVHINQPWR